MLFFGKTHLDALYYPLGFYFGWPRTTFWTYQLAYKATHCDIIWM